MKTKNSFSRKNGLYHSPKKRKAFVFFFLSQGRVFGFVKIRIFFWLLQLFCWWGWCAKTNKKTYMCPLPLFRNTYWLYLRITARTPKFSECMAMVFMETLDTPCFITQPYVGRTRPTSILLSFIYSVIIFFIFFLFQRGLFFLLFAYLIFKQRTQKTSSSFFFGDLQKSVANYMYLEK